MAINTLPANIYTSLSGYASLQALVANSDSPVTYRIFPSTRGHAGTEPFVIYRQISDVSYNVLDNAGGGGKRQVRIEVGSFAKTHVSAFAVAEAARKAMRDSALYVSSYQNTTETYYDDVKLYCIITQYLVVTV